MTSGCGTTALQADRGWQSWAARQIGDLRRQRHRLISMSSGFHFRLIGSGASLPALSNASTSASAWPHMVWFLHRHRCASCVFGGTSQQARHPEPWVCGVKKEEWSRGKSEAVVGLGASHGFRWPPLCRRAQMFVLWVKSEWKECGLKPAQAQSGLGVECSAAVAAAALHHCLSCPPRPHLQGCCCTGTKH